MARRHPRIPITLLEGLQGSRGGERYVLRLYVAGTTQRSTNAIHNVKQVCENRLAGRYDLEVIDLYQLPERAAADQVIAAPTLVKEEPGPLRRMVGDMSNLDRLLAGLGLRISA